MRLPKMRTVMRSKVALRERRRLKGRTSLSNSTSRTSEMTMKMILTYAGPMAHPKVKRILIVSILRQSLR